MWAGGNVLEARVSINGSVSWRATLEVYAVISAVPVQFLAPLKHKRIEVRGQMWLWALECVRITLWGFHSSPFYRHNPTRFGWICSIVWIPFLSDWQSLPGEPATDTRPLAGTWRRRAGEASGYYTVSRWCRGEGVQAGSWCQLWRMMTAPSPSFFCFLSHSSESLLRHCKIFGINVWGPTIAGI